jgi:pimeloyl-ACP methyl ester carboxylesterase
MSLITQVAVARNYTKSRFGQLHYIEGQPVHPVDEKPVLVLLHQNPASSVEYINLLAEMARDRRVIAFDTPGYGMSDGPGEPRLIGEYSASFADGLDNLGIAGPVDLFGFHTGTFMAAELAITRPDLIRRVMLSGIPFRKPEERAERLAAVQKTPTPTDDGASIFERLNWLWDYVVAKRTPGVSMDRATQQFVDKAKTLDRYWWAYFGVWSYVPEDRFPKITQPVMIVQPKEALFDESEAAGALIQNAEFVPLPTLNRDVFDVGVDLFAAEFRRFLG